MTRGGTKFEVINDFNYNGRSYKKGDILNEILSKMNDGIYNTYIESIGYISFKSCIFNNLRRIYE